MAAYGAKSRPGAPRDYKNDGSSEICRGLALMSLRELILY